MSLLYYISIINFIIYIIQLILYTAAASRLAAGAVAAAAVASLLMHAIRFKVCKS